VSPPAGVPVRGKVIMIHGFTACPQQFFEWSEQLAEKGWVSYLLTMPGHGRSPLPGGGEDFESIPGYGDDSGYADLARDVVKLAKSDELPTVVVGVSVGGAIALDAVLQSPEDFEQALLLSPFFAVAHGLGRTLGLPLVGRAPFIQNKMIGWGAPCIEEMKLGRGGVCNFRLHHIATAQSYGKKVAESAKPVVTRVQFIGVQDDPAASNEWSLYAAQKLGWKPGSSAVAACHYRKPANHSLLSRFDAPKEDKFWLDALLRDASAFVDESKFFPASGGSAKVFPLCSTEP
jgi:pimeloyl-ACP methyl ester carboxylesterase